MQLRTLANDPSVLGVARGLLLAGVGLGLASGCPRGDVGAPCNHGRIEPPAGQLVTFPALSCDALLCIYGEDAEAPIGACEPGPAGDMACNTADPEANRFECALAETGGRCQLRGEYVLSRSMCSKRCNTDADCNDGGIGQRVVAPGTQCGSGFVCAQIHAVGEFCCEKLCVCNDDWTAGTLAEDCRTMSGQASACCSRDPVPDACG